MLAFPVFQFLVATVPTVYGIETFVITANQLFVDRLQQYLPFTVLKQVMSVYGQPVKNLLKVATVPTVYGIET